MILDKPYTAKKKATSYMDYYFIIIFSIAFPKGSIYTYEVSLTRCFKDQPIYNFNTLIV